MSTSQIRIGMAVACAMLGLSHDARATLGGDVTTITANQQRLSAARAVKPLANGELHELRLASGTVVHEYLSPTGAVYAVSWSGRRIPDLRELLGSYFGELSSGGGHRRGGHHRMALSGTDLVLESSGHGHAFVGRAWVPSLVPAGVDPETSVEYGQ